MGKITANMKEKIRQIVEEIFYSPATNGQAEESILNGINKVESLIKEYSALMCEQQKRICNEAYLANPKRGLFQAGSEAILNAPLPTEIGDLVVLSKEEFEKIQNELNTYRGIAKNYMDSME